VEAARTSVLPEFSIRRSTRARRSRLTINDFGDAIVVLPVRAPDDVALDLVARHRRWITTHQGRIRARRSEIDARPALANGREILFGGELHRVVNLASIEPRQRPTVRLVDGRIVVTTSPLETRPLALILEGWLRARAREALDQRVTARAVEMDVEVKRVTIRDQRTRWGSASRSGTLSFSWRLILAPPTVLDYVVVHELAHLRVSGHGKRFWALVARHHPGADAARKWLRDHHDEVRSALD
jgi:predicted metal-dependent hydrolase